MATPLAVAGEAMETLKMKIFMLKKENIDVTEKMQEAEKVIDSAIKNIYIYCIFIRGMRMFHDFLFVRKRMNLTRGSRKPRIRSKNYQNRSTAGSCCWMTTRTGYRRTST